MEKNLESNKDKPLDFIKELWISKYDDFIEKIPKGKVLDLGCGIGQYTKYFLDKGFEVISSGISTLALNKLKESIDASCVIQMDMEKNFPFKENEFELVFANLSIHYFDKAHTEKILKEVKRVLKKGGYFIGSVNSSRTVQFLNGDIIEIEPNYYYENNRTARYWDEDQFNYFFKDLELVKREEVEITRWNLPKISWEFIYTKK